MAGVSFRVRPSISGDRRFLTLRITQIVGITKTTKLDASTGREVPVESANRLETTVAGKVHIPDGDAILMPIHYRVAGKAGEDKVWVLVAGPIIWIEEEEDELRRQGQPYTPRSIWNKVVPKEERPAPGK